MENLNENGEPDGLALRRSQIEEVIPIFVEARRSRKEANRRINIRPSKSNRSELLQLLRPEGFDADRFESIRAQISAELRARAKKLRADAAARSSTSDAFDLDLARRIDDLKHPLVPPGGYVLALNTPYKIVLNNTPNASQQSNHYEPYKSAGKYLLNAATDDVNVEGDENVSFYFAWVNTTNSPILIDAIALLTIYGFGVLEVSGGWYGFQDVAVWANVNFSALRMWTNPPSLVPADPNNRASELIGRLFETNTWWVPPTLQNDLVHRNYIPGYWHPNSISVPVNGVLAFEANVDIEWGLTEGSINFEFTGGDFGIFCPYVLISSQP